jgi:hypothetical protein
VAVNLYEKGREMCFVVATNLGNALRKAFEDFPAGLVRFPPSDFSDDRRVKSVVFKDDLFACMRGILSAHYSDDRIERMIHDLLTAPLVVPGDGRGHAIDDDGAQATPEDAEEEERPQPVRKRERPPASDSAAAVASSSPSAPAAPPALKALFAEQAQLLSSIVHKEVSDALTESARMAALAYERTTSEFKERVRAEVLRLSDAEVKRLLPVLREAALPKAREEAREEARKLILQELPEIRRQVLTEDFKRNYEEQVRSAAAAESAPASVSSPAQAAPKASRGSTGGGGTATSAPFFSEGEARNLIASVFRSNGHDGDDAAAAAFEDE